MTDGADPPRDAEGGRSVYVGGYRLDVVVRPHVAVPVPVARLARVAARALAAAGASVPSSLGLVLSDDAELATLNEAHLGHEGPTDVLSFPLVVSTDGNAGPPGAAGSVAFVLPPGRRVHLGDVIVSVERARAQAAEGRGGQTGDVRWSVGDELRLLVVHGALHVCGWDHAEPGDEAAMRELEREVLATD
ncbi:MAG TPA: rRNA maturation RNase YbeY [Candidatus Limnocylindrales bacterium]|nr:rRNA maturation RNase YbeY [Candidatus Limnocylindrales bacterium]